MRIQMKACDAIAAFLSYTSFPFEGINQACSYSSKSHPSICWPMPPLKLLKEQLVAQVPAGRRATSQSLSLYNPIIFNRFVPFHSQFYAFYFFVCWFSFVLVLSSNSDNFIAHFYCTIHNKLKHNADTNLCKTSEWASTC